MINLQIRKTNIATLMKNIRPTPRPSCRAPQSRSCLTATIAHPHIPRLHFYHIPVAAAARSPRTLQTRRAIAKSSPAATNTVRAAVRRILARRHPIPLPAARARQASSIPATRRAVSFRTPQRLHVVVDFVFACPNLLCRGRVMSNVKMGVRGVCARVDGDVMAIGWLDLY